MSHGRTRIKCGATGDGKDICGLADNDIKGMVWLNLRPSSNCRLGLDLG